MNGYEVLAKAEFTAKSGDEVYRITVEMIPHGGFDYGNRHALVYKVRDEVTGKRFLDQCFDARYDSRFSNKGSF